MNKNLFYPSVCGNCGKHILVLKNETISASIKELEDGINNSNLIVNNSNFMLQHIDCFDFSNKEEIKIIEECVNKKILALIDIKAKVRILAKYFNVEPKDIHFNETNSISILTK